MTCKKFAMGTAVFMGAGCREILLAQAKLLGGTSALLVTDKGLMKAGVVDKVLSGLDQAKLKVTVFDEVMPDPSVRTVDAGGALAREKGCDIVITVGGGSPIDAAKGIRLSRRMEDPAPPTRGSTSTRRLPCRSSPYRRPSAPGAK